MKISSSANRLTLASVNGMSRYSAIARASGRLELPAISFIMEGPSYARADSSARGSSAAHHRIATGVRAYHVSSPPQACSADPMLGAHLAHGAGAGAHHHALGRHRSAAATLRPFEEGAVGDPGRGKDAVTFRQVFKTIDSIKLFDPPFAGAAPLVIVAEQQPPVELPTNAAQRRRRQDPFRSAA